MVDCSRQHGASTRETNNVLYIVDLPAPMDMTRRTGMHRSRSNHVLYAFSSGKNVFSTNGFENTFIRTGQCSAVTRCSPGAGRINLRVDWTVAASSTNNLRKGYLVPIPREVLKLPSCRKVLTLREVQNGFFRRFRERGIFVHLSNRIKPPLRVLRRCLVQSPGASYTGMKPRTAVKKPRIHRCAYRR